MLSFPVSACNVSCKHESPTSSTHCPPLTELSHCNLDKVLGSEYHHTSAQPQAAAAWEVPQQPRLYATSKPTPWPCIQLPTGPGGSWRDSKHWGGVRNRALFPVEPTACTEVALSKCQDLVTGGTCPLPRPAPATLCLGSPGSHPRLFPDHLQGPPTPGCWEQARCWGEGTDCAQTTTSKPRASQSPG